MKKIMLTLIMGFCFTIIIAQPSYGFKGGLTLANQNWNGQERDALLGYHGVAFLESQAEEKTMAVYSELGYHLKGSAIRRRETSFFNPSTGQEQVVEAGVDANKFHNISLSLGAKSRFGMTETIDAYYLLGVRGDFTAKGEINFYPSLEQGIRKFTYGVTAGGGLEFNIANGRDLLIEFQVNPDFSPQIYVQPGFYEQPYTRQLIQQPEQRVTNLAFEISVGLRFVPSEIEWEYED